LLHEISIESLESGVLGSIASGISCSSFRPENVGTVLLAVSLEGIVVSQIESEVEVLSIWIGVGELDPIP